MWRAPDQEQDRELTQQLATTAGVVVALKGQLGAKEAQASKLEQQVAALKEDYRQSTVQLDDKARAAHACSQSCSTRGRCMSSKTCLWSASC